MVIQEKMVEGFRLSPQQRALWLLQQEGLHGHAQCAVLIEGPLRRDDLRAALEEVAGRHEILRTTFHLQPGIKVPLQVVQEESELLWEVASAPDTDPGTLDRVLKQERRRPFRLDELPVLRALLLELAPGRHLLVLTLPALAADGRTLRNLLGEVTSAYAGTAAGSESEPLQYADFAEWQHELCAADESDAMAKAEALRREALALPPLRLPFERRDGSALGFAPGVCRLEVPADVAQELSVLARMQEATMAAVLAAAWQTVLARFTGEWDLCLACLFEGRGYEELEGGFGPYARWIPLPSRPRPTEELAGAVARVQAQLAGIADWQHYFMPEGSEEERGPEICFEHAALPGAWSAGGALLSVVGRSVQAGRFRLKLSCLETGGALAVDLHYDAALFRREDVEGLGRSFLRLLKSAVERPGARLAELEILDEAPETPAPVPAEAVRGIRGIHRLIEEQAALWPERPAVLFEGTELTYAELNARANRLARHLRRLGAGPDSVVALFLERSSVLVETLLASLKAGAAYAVLEPGLPGRRIAAMLEDLRSPVVVTTAALAASLPREAAGRVLCLDRLDRDTGIFAGESSADLEGEDTPRLARLRRLHLRLDRPAERGGGGAPAPPRLSPGRHGAAEAAGRGPLRHRVHLRRRPGPHHGLPRALLGRLPARGVAGPPGGRRRSGRRLREPPGGLPEDRAEPPAGAAGRGARRAGAAAPAPGAGRRSELLGPRRPSARPGARLPGVQPLRAVGDHGRRHRRAAGPRGGGAPRGAAAGPAAVRSVHPPPGRQPAPGAGLGNGRPLRRRRHGHAGLPRAARSHGRRLPPRSVRRGGGRTHVPHRRPRAPPGGRTHRVPRPGDGQIKFHGFRVELEEVRAALVRHPLIADGIITLTPAGDGEGREMLAAYYVSREELEPAHLRAFLGESLQAETLPNAYVRLDRLPLTPNGKVDLRALPSPEEAMSRGRRAPVPARTPVETALARLWAEALGRPEPPAPSTTSSSSAAIRCSPPSSWRGCARSSQIVLPLRVLLEGPTVAGLAEAVSRERARPAKARRSPRRRCPPWSRTRRGGTSRSRSPTSSRPTGWAAAAPSSWAASPPTPTSSSTARASTCRGSRRAWQRLIERHDMLRAVVLPDGTQQRPRRGAAVRIEVLDLRGHDRRRGRRRALAELRERHVPPGAAAGPLAALRGPRHPARRRRGSGCTSASTR